MLSPFKNYIDQYRSRAIINNASLLPPQDHLSWVDATNMAALCYLASYSVAPPNLQTAWVVKATEEEQARYTEWHDAACTRRSEAGEWDI